MKKIRSRVSVIVLHDGKILGFHAEDPLSHQKYFFLPGGKIEESETPEEAAIRETQEETGYSIKIISEKPQFERYDFIWNGDTNDCQAWFFAGQLEPRRQPLHQVKDADYHRGVDWIPIEKINEVFNYHETILRAVQALVQLIQSS